MCGITGIVYNDTCRHLEIGLLERMCSVIRHRGPDDMGTWVQGNVGIGMTRLSIIDLESGHQPIHNEDESKWIVFNGEIYNYKELRHDLLKRGHRFYTSSDTEAIIHLYEDYEDECVNYLRGMFSFAVWDNSKMRLFLARDRLGIKPLHYFLNGEKLIFGSEIKSIIQCLDVPREMNPPALINYLPYGYVPDPETMFKDIYKLPPGHTLTYKSGQLDIKKYWDVVYKSEKIQSEEFYIERLIEILSEAVKIRMISEVPLGAFLSGGIDSSMVVALMSKYSSGPVKTFSIGFENQKYNELSYASMVATKYGTDHHEEIVNPDAESIIMDLVRQFDEPFADSSMIPTYYVSRLARKNVTVALSGDGGDELFGGYDRYLDIAVTKLSRNISPIIKKDLILRMTKVLPEWFPGINILRDLSCYDDESYLRSISKGLTTSYKNVFSREICEQVLTTDPSSIMMEYLNSVCGQDIITKKTYLDIKTYLPGDILTKVDRTSMMVSLEARLPILDHHLVEFAATIPAELKVKGKTLKYIFKKAAERFLPKEVIYRPKRGFAVPVKMWIKKEWSEMCHELVLGERSLARNNFNPRFLNTIMAEHRIGRRDHSYIIWTIMMLELWFREMID